MKVKKRRKTNQSLSSFSLLHLGDSERAWISSSLSHSLITSPDFLKIICFSCQLSCLRSSAWILFQWYFAQIKPNEEVFFYCSNIFFNSFWWLSLLSSYALHLVSRWIAFTLLAVSKYSAAWPNVESFRSETADWQAFLVSKYYLPIINLSNKTSKNKTNKKAPQELYEEYWKGGKSVHFGKIEEWMRLEFQAVCSSLHLQLRLSSGLHVKYSEIPSILWLRNQDMT